MVVWLVGWFDVLKIGSGAVLYVYDRGRQEYFPPVIRAAVSIISCDSIYP